MDEDNKASGGQAGGGLQTDDGLKSILYGLNSTTFVKGFANQKRTKDEWITWWIDGCIRLGIPMMENTIIADDRQVLTDGCQYAKSRGATLVKTPRIWHVWEGE